MLFCGILFLCLFLLSVLINIRTIKKQLIKFEKYEQYYGYYILSDGNCVTYKELLKFSIKNYFLWLVSGYLFLISLYFLPIKFVQKSFLYIAILVGAIFLVWLFLILRNLCNEKKYENKKNDLDENATNRKNIFEKKEEILNEVNEVLAYDYEHYISQSKDVLNASILDATAAAFFEECCDECDDPEEIYRLQYEKARKNLKTPEELLKELSPKEYKKEKRDGTLNKVFGVIGDFIDGGRSEAVLAEENYKNIQMVYDVYLNRLDVTNKEAYKARTLYELCIEKVNLFASKIKLITEKLNPKEREALLKVSNSKELAIAEANVEENRQIQALEKNLSSYKKDIENSIEEFIDAQGKAGKALAIGKVALNVGKHYLERTNINLKKTGEYTKSTTQILENIKEIEKERVEKSAFVQRTNEIIKGINNGLDTYSKTYEFVYQTLFPSGDVSKTRESRSKREDGFYTTEENELIFKKIAVILKFVLQMTDAEF